MKNYFNSGKKFLILTSLLIIGFSYLQPAAAGSILVANQGSNSVSIFDEESLKLIKEIPVGFRPHEVEVTPDGKMALVSNFGTLIDVIPGRTLSLIDVANAQVLKTISLPNGSRPHGIKFLSNTQALVTAQGIQSLLLVDILQGTVLKTIPLPGSGAHIVITNRDMHYGYIANIDSGDVIKVDLQNFTVVGTIKVGQTSEGITLTPDEQFVLATDRKDNLLAVINTNDMTLVKNISTDKGPIRVKLFDNGKSAVVTNSIGGTAQIIDIESLNITKTFKTTDSPAKALTVPNNIAVRDDQTSAYIANIFAGKITLVDLENGVILKTFKANNQPNGIAISPVSSN